MNTNFVNLTTENLSNEHLCCIIRSKKSHPGIEAKRQWLSDRLNEGHVFRKLNAKATVFIEYAPLETAWVPVIGDNYYYLYCLWVLGSPRGNGYGKALIEYCIADAKEKVDPAFVCSGQKNRRAGFLINHLQRNLVLRLLTLPITDMNCLLFLLTEQHRNLRQMPRI